MPDDLRFTDREEFDRPDARLDAFFQWMGTAPQNYFGVLDAALTHQAGATVDGSPRHWVSIGPRNVGGAVRCLAQHPTTPDTFFAGSAQGGLWRSDDSGYSWRPFQAPPPPAPPMLPPGVPVGAIAIAPSNPQIIYVGTGEPITGQVAGNGLYRSLDGGTTFPRLVGAASTGANGAADHYARIVVDPHEPERIWMATERGLWRRDPGGAFTREVLPAAAGPNPTMTDVALAPDPNNADQYVLLAGVQGKGIFQAVYTRSTATMGAWRACNGPWPATIGRVRVAFSGDKTKEGKTITPIAYALMEDQGHPTVIYKSTDLSKAWPARDGARAIEPDSKFAWYSLCLAVSPDDPDRIVAGCLNVHQSGDGGMNFSPPSQPSAPILDWLLYDRGDRAQHADQHFILFDSRESCRLLVCNDGGISYTPDFLAVSPPPPEIGPVQTPKPRWRKRSYGIVAAQLTGLATHPTYPFVCGGGMQDNGTFVSFGGPTWYRLFGADGGETGMDAADPRHFYASWQSHPPGSPSGIEEVRISPPGKPPYPENSTILPDIDPPQNVMVPRVAQELSFPADNGALWIGVIAFDPAASKRMLIGRKKGSTSNAGFYTSDGVTMTPLNTPGISGDVSAAAFSPNAPDLWLGTTSGQLYTVSAVAPAAPGAWTFLTIPAPGAGGPITSIAVHPQNANVVAVSTMGSGKVFLSHDKGAHWVQINGGATQNLPPGPIPCVAWDPSNTQILFAGTLAGMYVTRDLPARAAGSADLTTGAAVTPHWFTYSLGLPILQINEISVTPNGTLRVATYGRGAWESDLPGTPANFKIPQVRLSIRDDVADDSRTYPPANALNDDPRLPAGARPVDRTRAFDIRIDAPGFVRSEAFDFGEDIDGVEFDETLVCDKPIVGEVNRVYVQVHNRGWGDAADVQVFLYYADAGNPAAAPPIDAGFGFPGLPTAASKWRLVEARKLPAPVHSGHPVVVRFEWTPLVDIKDNVALLAICTSPVDGITSPIAPGPVDAFVAGERRAALRVTPVRRDTLYVRHGVDDDGTLGAVAWGGRSPDIIVSQAVVANPNGAAGPLADLADRREGDVVKAGANHVYVRVSNRMEVEARAKVRLYVIPANSPAPASGWTPIGEAATDPIPAHGWKFASIDWNGVADPDPSSPGGYKAFALVAVASLVDAGGAALDPYPDTTWVTDIDGLWRFLTDGPGTKAAAMRALRFKP